MMPLRGIFIGLSAALIKERNAGRAGAENSKNLRDADFLIDCINGLAEAAKESYHAMTARNAQPNHLGRGADQGSRP